MIFPFLFNSIHTHALTIKKRRDLRAVHSLPVCADKPVFSFSLSLSAIHSQTLSHWLVTAAWSQSGFSAEVSVMIWVWWPLQDGWWGMRVPREGAHGGGGSATLTFLLCVCVGGRCYARPKMTKAVLLATFCHARTFLRLGKQFYTCVRVSFQTN